MSKKLFSTICLVGMLAGSIFAQAQEKKVWSLRQCIEYALTKNISIKQADLRLMTAEVDKKDAKGNFLPTLSAEANNVWNVGLTQNITTGLLQNQTTRFSSYGITSAVNLYSGSRNFYELQRARMAITAAQYSAEQIKDDVMLNVANSYLNVLFNKEAVKQLTAQNEITLKQLNFTKERIDAGTLPAGDLLEVQATDAQEKQQIIAAQNDVQISLLTLAQILNLEDTDNFDILEPTVDSVNGLILDSSVAEVFAQALENRYEIKIAEQNTTLAEQDLKLAKSAQAPTVTAFFNYNTRESGQGRPVSQLAADGRTRPIGFVEGSGEVVVAPDFDVTEGNPDPFFQQLYQNDGIGYGVGVQIPILNGLNTRSNIERSKIAVENNKLLEEQARIDLRRNVNQAFNDARGARATYESAQAAVDAREQAFIYAQDRFDVGLMNAFDFNQAQVALTTARITLLRSKYDYLFRIKVLELFSGMEPSEIGL